MDMDLFLHVDQELSAKTKELIIENAKKLIIAHRSEAASFYSKKIESLRNEIVTLKAVNATYVNR